MLSILAAAVLCLSPAVHDGDSLRCGAEKIRIADIDAPELAGSPKCQRATRPAWAWCDYVAGVAARDAVKRLLRGRRVTFVRTGTDKYGRTLALVYAGEIEVGAWLVAKGLARSWR